MEQTKNKVLFMMLDTKEIIISEVAEAAAQTSGWFVFDTPALVTAQRSPQGALGLMLTPWLPHELLTGPHISFRERNVIGLLSPHPNLVSFYESWAACERDKMTEFGQDFAAQITELQKYHAERYARTKEIHKEEHKNPMPNQYSPLTGVIYDMFDNDKDWGDPSVTH